MWKMIFSCDGIWPFIWNAPKSRNFIFGSFSVLKLITCLFFEMPHFSHFQNQIGKNGAFQKIKTWSIQNQKRNRKWNSSILGYFKKLLKFYHMTKSSFTCFLGHFMIPRVKIKRLLLWKIVRVSFKVLPACVCICLKTQTF